MNRKLITRMSRTAFQSALATFLALQLAATAADSPKSRDKEIKIDLEKGVVIELIRIEPNEFLMGSPPSDDTRGDRPQHKVRISKPFYLGKCEVTQALWMHVMGENPSTTENKPNTPVETVSWNDCQRFTEKLNKIVSGGRFRLPTEAEWEYACRAGEKTRFSFGDGPPSNSDPSPDLDANAWTSRNAGNAPHETGTKKPNPWGLHDMYGNVWEWCQDLYGPYETTKDEVLQDPLGKTGTERVLRGGAFINWPDACQSDSRGSDKPTASSVFYGLRLARDVE